MDLIVFDLSTAAFRRAGGQVLLSLPGLRDVFASAPEAGASDREAVFSVLDGALEELRIPSGASWARVGFYNPLTAQVAVGGVPHTETFGDGSSLELGLYGSPAHLVDGILRIGSRELVPAIADAGQVRRLLAAHSA